ncbi:hypothetical protein A3D80_03195 [Candidatus Roizmanbacteria bacterium RIFCSPHIGHO2_02_FULL_40_13b]|nr:MAG: hypothetical protein A3D80_03195 [Candidatus Roizmanbacteria bacterium RIFCSPHIGHO2_02_FULL_40_13b]OGK57515.1 MAG: hypothetical protein A3H83_00920 [Candidatus Roizmanbacteria bacterium RIFCSPLOWO2_02_FULL_39_8]
MNLTPTQKKAISNNEGPLLIIAGAGTGKTTVLVEKIKYLVSKNLAKPEEILALTFTEKAAQEIEERVDLALPMGYFQMQISTFHAFCDKILRNEIINIGLSPAYTLQTQAQTMLFLRQNLPIMNLTYFRPLSNPNKFLYGLLQHFSRLRDEDVSPEEYDRWIKRGLESSSAGGLEEKGKYKELAKAYSEFQNLKIKNNVFDFADLIYYTLKLFRTRKKILEQYQNKYKYILVDEFQDTNIAQYALIKLLAPPKSNKSLTVIGDDNQSIYKFRGAAISNILTFKKDYKKTKTVVLNENFRSTQKILDVAYKVIQNNNPDTLESKLGISKELKSQQGEGATDDIELKLNMNVVHEADAVISNIEKRKKENPKLTFNDFAILTRANAHIDPFIKALSAAGIPYQVNNQGLLFKQPEIKDLISFLYILNDVNDSTAFFRVISMDIFDIDSTDIAKLVSFARKVGVSFLEATSIYVSSEHEDFRNENFEQYKPYLPVLKIGTKERLYKVITQITDGISRISKDSAGQILYYFLENSGLMAKISVIKTEKEEIIAKNISRFFNKLKSFELTQVDASVNAVVEYLTLCMEMGESPITENDDWEQMDAVNILTVHGSKGLEFDTVFLVNLTSGRFPTIYRREQIPLPDGIIKELLPTGDAHMQEERRLFYVGITRAKNKLFLSASYFYGEGKRRHKLSPFIDEALDPKLIQKAKNETLETLEQLPLFDLAKIKDDFEKKPEKKSKALSKTKTLFSYSQIQTYQICPLRYKYQYVVKLPVTAGFAASFGDSMHKALQYFYTLHLKDMHPTLDDLYDLYYKYWVPVGYGSKQYEEKVKNEGKRLLQEFYDTYHSENIQIAGLEQWFKIKITDSIFISGKIDRIDLIENDSIEIIDYKTGKVPTDAELKKEMQLALYALAATDKSLYAKDLSQIKLTYYYLQENKKMSLTRTQKDIDTVIETVSQTAQAIQSGNFEPRVGPWCGFCPFKINCEVWQ